MDRLLTATALALALVAPSVARCFADEPMKLDDTIEMFFESAKTRPDFQMTHMCPQPGQCQTVAVATREPDMGGHVGRDIFIKFDGKDHKRWCYQTVVGPNSHTRLCQETDASGAELNWTEAYFPSEKTWKKIEIDRKVAACADLQMSKYETDDAYADCVVNKMEHDAVAAKVEATAKAETNAKADAEAERPRIEADVKAKIESEQAQIEADAKAKVRAEIEADLRAKAEADAKAKAEAEAKAQIEAASKAKDKALEDAKAANAARLEAEAVARHDDQVRADKAAAQHDTEEEARIKAEAEAAHEENVRNAAEAAKKAALAETERLNMFAAQAEGTDDSSLPMYCNGLSDLVPKQEYDMKIHSGEAEALTPAIEQAKAYCAELQKRGLESYIHANVLDILRRTAKN